MAGSPTVSVITPVYNGARYLDECIASVRRQTFGDWELVVYDNCSTDGSDGIALSHAAQDGRIRLIRAPDFSSIWRNHNRALATISPVARYVKFVHADDRLYPECLERMVAVAEAHPTVGLVGSYRLVGAEPSGGGVFQPGEEVKPGREVIRTYLVHGQAITGSPTTVMLRADLVRNAAPFYDEEFWHSDTDSSCRVLLGCDCGFVPQILTFTRLHPEAQTSRSFRINTFLPNEGRLLARYGPLTLTPREHRALMRRFLGRYTWFLAKQVLRPWRHRDEDYQQFHRREIEGMLADATTDRETSAVLGALRCLLHRQPRSRAE